MHVGGGPGYQVCHGRYADAVGQLASVVQRPRCVLAVQLLIFGQKGVRLIVDIDVLITNKVVVFFIAGITFRRLDLLPGI